MAQFATLYSGSSGNSAAVAEDGSFLLVDMGKNCKTTLTALQSLGLEPRSCRGILVTHEHSDHISGLRVFLKKYRLPVYGGVETLERLEEFGAVPENADLIPINGRDEDIGGFRVTAFATSHDSAGCCGFRIETPAGRTLAIATDLGEVDEQVCQYLRGCSLVALEANYDTVMLQMGPYPYYLKTRIRSPKGHLSNDDCARVLAELAAQGCRKFALCHLSQENNAPDLARQTVVQRMAEEGLFSDGETPLPLVQVSPRYEVSPVIEF